MTYRYADNSPFPLEHDFLATLARMIRASVRALAFEDELIRSENRARRVREEAERASELLDAVGGRVITAIADSEEAEEPGVAGLVRKVMEETARTVGGYRRRVTLRRDAKMLELAEEEVRGVRAFLELIAGDLAVAGLPGAREHVTWEADVEAGARLVVSEEVDPGLEASWRIAIPAGNRFAGPVRVGDLRRGTSLPLPVARGWIRRRTDVAAVCLDDARLVSAARMPEGVSLIIAPRAHGGELVSLWIEGGGGRVSVNGAGVDLGTLEGADAHAVRALATDVMLALRSLRGGQRTLLSLTIDGVPVEQRPAAFAERVIELLAPVVREVRRRGPRPGGELVLKRDVGANRREELFLSVRELLDPVLALPVARQAAFAPLGYETGPLQARQITVTPSPETTEVAREFVVAPRRVPVLRADDSVILRKVG